MCVCMHGRACMCELLFLGGGRGVDFAKFFGCVRLCVNYTTSSRGPKRRTIWALLMGIGVEKEDSHQVFSGFMD